MKGRGSVNQMGKGKTNTLNNPTKENSLKKKECFSPREGYYTALERNTEKKRQKRKKKP